MSIKAHIAHPVTRVALDETVAVRPSRQTLARAGRPDPRSTSATTINGRCIVIPVPDKIGDVVEACGVRARAPGYSGLSGCCCCSRFEEETQDWTERSGPSAEFASVVSSGALKTLKPQTSLDWE
jgi:hypothetical protein